MNNTILGKNIRFLRKSRRFTQQKLADALNLNRNQISSYESGQVEPRASILVRMGQLFEVHPADLLERDLEFSASAGIDGKDLRLSLDKLDELTKDMQLVVQGYRAYYQSSQFIDSFPQSFHGNDLSPVLLIIEQLIRINTAFLNDLIQEDEN